MPYKEAQGLIKLPSPCAEFSAWRPLEGGRASGFLWEVGGGWGHFITGTAGS